MQACSATVFDPLEKIIITHWTAYPAIVAEIDKLTQIRRPQCSETKIFQFILFLLQFTYLIKIPDAFMLYTQLEEEKSHITPNIISTNNKIYKVTLH